MSSTAPTTTPSLVRTRQAAIALRAKWQQASELSLLGWISLLDPALAEMASEWGYDGLIIDTEHSPYGILDLQAILMAFRGTPCVPIVRVAASDMADIKHALDLGAHGILIPQIEDAAQAAAAVSFCRYPPRGRRGFSPRRASNYFRDMAGYLAEADDATLVMVQIECYSAYQNLDAIMAVPGIDCLFIGQADMAASMGHIGAPAHPDVARVTEDIIRRCRQAGRPVAVASSADPQQIMHWWKLGANVISSGGDIGFMLAGFAAYRKALAGAGVPFTLAG